MQNKAWRRSFFALLGGTLVVTSSITHAANIVVGSGTHSSTVVIESPNVGQNVYEVFYDYDPGDPLDGYDLLAAIDASDDSLEMSFINYGSVESPNYFLNAITMSGTTETNTGAPSYAPYWAQWVSGGEAGFGSIVEIPLGTWTFGSGFSAPYRVVEPGSWDAIYYSDGSAAPNITPIPEPSSALLMGFAGLLMWRRRR